MERLVGSGGQWWTSRAEGAGAEPGAADRVSASVIYEYVSRVSLARPANSNIRSKSRDFLHLAVNVRSSKSCAECWASFPLSAQAETPPKLWRNTDR